MDNPPPPEDGNEPAATKEAAIQTALDNVRYLQEKESQGNSLTSGGSADGREEMSSTRNVRDKIFTSVHSQGHICSPSVLDSRSFNTVGTFRNHSHPYGVVMVSSDSTWNKSASNYIFMNETNTDHTKYKPEIWGHCGKDLTDSQQCKTYNKTVGLNATRWISIDNSALASMDYQNIEWNNNISGTYQEYNSPSNTSPSIAFHEGSVCSVNDGFIMPGPSGLTESKSASNLFGEASRSFKCMVCKVAISFHAIEENVFKCCKCPRTNCEEVDLQIHSFSHVPETTCSKCEKKHAARNSHNSQHTCPVPKCERTFHCRTELHEHFLVHRDYFFINCWVCRREFSVHKESESNSSYVCCVCGKDCNQQHNFKTHNRLHLPRIY